MDQWAISATIIGVAFAVVFGIVKSKKQVRPECTKRFEKVEGTVEVLKIKVAVKDSQYEHIIKDVGEIKLMIGKIFEKIERRGKVREEEEV